jgi:outer membrane protein TolC
VPPKPPDIPAWRDVHPPHRAPVTPRSDPDPVWSTSFGDPVLTTLIGNAIGGNLDLQQAVLRVVESRQGEVSAGAAALPTVSGNGSYVREQLGLRGLLLSRGAFDQARRDRIPEAVKSAEMTLYLARDSYEHGLVDFIQVLDAQRTLVTIRQQLVQADVALINDVVGLYNALGGGWQAAGLDLHAPMVATAPPVTPAALDSLVATAPK